MYEVHFETLGCRLNQIESESLAASFASAGFVVEMEPVSASAPVRQAVSICVVNTCTVTSKSEQKARRLIRLLLSRFPEAAVIVTGCYAELEREEIAALGDRVVVLPGKRKSILTDIACTLIDELDVLKKTDGLQGIPIAAALDRLLSGLGAASPEPFKLSADTFLRHSRPLLKIQDGCANICSYCRIRYARGAPVSLDVQEIVNRVRQLEGHGYHEVVLTGVNLSQYRGVWMGDPVRMTDLLQILLENTSRIMFRISSLYPEYIDDAFCRAVSHERIVPYFHLSVQSGSDSVLSAMRRPYISVQVAEAAARLRQAKENPFISCDLIVGFPGETDEDFMQTLDLCSVCAFAWMHVFPFSPRPGTEASSLEPKVPQSVVTERARKLTAAAVLAKEMYIRSCAGRVVPAVIEYCRQDAISDPEVLHAVTSNFLHVKLDNVRKGDLDANRLVSVKINGPVREKLAAGDIYDTSGSVV